MVFELSALKSPQHLSDPLGLGCKCRGDDHVVGSPASIFFMIPSLSSFRHAFSPSTALGDPGMIGRTLALHGCASPVSMLWVTL